MRLRHRTSFSTIRTEGAILPPDLLERIHEGDNDLGGLKERDYHLQPGERLNEVISRSWNRMLGTWRNIQADLKKLPDEDPGTTVTRERLLLVLFQELGYGRLQTTKALELEGKSYPVSHEWNRVPIHLVGARVGLDKRTPGVAGAARSSPHSMVQELLNRSDEHLWAFLSNGYQLRILRDNISLVRQAYVEFDLHDLFEGEAYSDFTLLWMLCHESRVEADVPEEFWLEKWSQQAQEQGARALDQLRGGVEAAIRDLGQGFLIHPANQALQEHLRSSELTGEEYYRQLLRLVYRLIFLFAAEDRGLLHPSGSDSEARERYQSYYSTDRLRRLARRRRGTRHEDLFQGLKLVMGKLGQEGGCPELGLPALGSFLWSENAIPDLEPARISNHAFLDALRSLAFSTDGSVRRAVDYKNMGAEELGSVYESLLELQPELNTDAGTFALKVVGGSERKTTGSYYTPSSLIQQLLNTALDPVVEEALKAEDPEAALLDLKVCDPACGSGHFLIAAAHRMAKHLATIQTGDPEPSPKSTRSALREVIAHCIYGVDVNPMAVELCKVNLWLEALDPGKPLSFLDHRIQCGNSLIGTTPALIEGGIPDDAFKPIEGDDKKFASALRKQNKAERAGQMSMFEGWVAEERAMYQTLSIGMEGLAVLEEDTLEAQRQKKAEYEWLISTDEYRRGKLVADAWCAAFFWPKREGAPPSVTQAVFRKLATDPKSVAPETIHEIDKLARQYRLFHWHLAFPEAFQEEGGGSLLETAEAGWSGGFDVVLGNPPWERVKLQEKEWFAGREEGITSAPNKAARTRLIKKLTEDDPALYQAFLDAKRTAEGESHFLRHSGRYPLCGRGDINTYAVFAELNRELIEPKGRVGCIVPSGVATDDTTKYFFQDLMEKSSLVSLYDFENRKKLFTAVDSRIKFCLLTLTGVARPAGFGADFVFFAMGVEDLREKERHFSLSGEEIALLNPNTRTCSIFRSKKDAELTKAIYRRVVVLVKEGPPEENPWAISIRRIFDMNRSDVLGICTPSDRINHLSGFCQMLESKMMHQFDHHFADYYNLSEETRSTRLPEMPIEKKQNPTNTLMPRYWVPNEEVNNRFGDLWQREWLLTWRDITNTTNERTVISSILPFAGTDFTLRVG
ncbi:MAG: Eco57I restriction-modification methylase domain-containing protein, partial [Anaerolineales bacterium]